jgi:hypothetical protein
MRSTCSSPSIIKADSLRPLANRGRNRTFNLQIKELTPVVSGDGE